MSRQQALADLAAASSSADVLGQTVAINGTDVACSKVMLPQDESASWAPEGMRVEVVKIASEYEEIGFLPVLRTRINIDGQDYEVRQSTLAGSLVKFVSSRNLA